jgi:hypothetical protein
MSGTVLIVLAALFGWCVLSVVLALFVGRRLGAASASMRRRPPAFRPLRSESRSKERRPAA